MRRVAALLLLVGELAGCGGTIYYGSSSPSPRSQIEPSSSAIQAELPSPPPGSTPGTLMAFDAKTGASLWQSQAPMSATTLLTVSGGLVFVVGGYGGPSGVIAAFEAQKGDLIWRAPTPGPCGFENTVAVGSGVVLTTSCTPPARPPFSGQSIVHGVDPKTGRELWTAEGIAAVAGPSVAMVIVQGPSGGFKVRGLDLATGQQIWEAKPTVTNIPPDVNGRVALVVGYGCPTESPAADIKPSNCTGPGQAGSFVSSLDPATGSQRWQILFGPGSQIRRRLLLGDVAVYLVAVETPPSPGNPPPAEPGPERLGALDLATGNELWRQTVAPETVTPIGAVAGTVFLEHVQATTQQCMTRIDALDSRSGTLRWRLDNLPFCQANVAAEGSTTVLLLASQTEAKLMVADTATGTKVWEKPITIASPYPLVSASVSGGVVYVAASGRFTAPTNGG